MYEIGKGEKKAFQFKIEGERKVYSVPLLGNLPLKWVRKLADARGDNAASLVFFIDLFDEYAPGVTDKLDTREFEALYNAWSEAGDATLGE